MMEITSPVLSIITVVYNAEKLIEPTLKSVMDQTYSGIEYILIDGASKDQTLAIVQKYRSGIAILVSEKDQGIYDAMNKGLARATGDYVLFLNAGDLLYDPETIAKIFLQNPPSDIYYGEVENIDFEGHSLGLRRLRPPEKLDWKSFRWGMLVSHQAIIVRKSLTDPFDRNYKISADIDWCINSMKKAKVITHTHQIISKYLVGGVSRQNTILSWKERFQIMRDHYGVISTFLFHVLIGFRFIGYYLRSGKLD